MLTDSRSFLSYPRHEYFRRLLCNIIGNDVENGLLPNDIETIKDMVRRISYGNAVQYFEMEAGEVWRLSNLSQTMKKIRAIYPEYVFKLFIHKQGYQWYDFFYFFYS